MDRDPTHGSDRLSLSPKTLAVHPNLNEALATIRRFGVDGEECGMARLELIAMIQHGLVFEPYRGPLELLLTRRMSRGIVLAGQLLTGRQLAALVETPEGYRKWCRRHGY